MKRPLLFRQHGNLFLVGLISVFFVSCYSYHDKKADEKVMHFYQEYREQIESFIKYSETVNSKDSSLLFMYLSKGNPHFQAFKADGRKADVVVDQSFEFFFSSNDINSFCIKDSMQSFYFYKIRNKSLNGLSLIRFEKPFEKTEGDSIDGIVILGEKESTSDQSYYRKIDDHWYIFSKK